MSVLPALHRGYGDDFREDLGHTQQPARNQDAELPALLELEIWGLSEIQLGEGGARSLRIVLICFMSVYSTSA